MLTILGFTSADKVPGGVAETQWGQGRVSIGSIALTCNVYGNATGSNFTEGVAYAITAPSDAINYFGAQSELTNMCLAALDVPGVVLFAIPVAEAGGAAAAVCTLTIAGSWTTTGEFTMQLDDVVFRVSFGSQDSTVTLAAVEVVAGTNSQYNGNLFCTAANSSGVVTFTTASKGVRQNQHTAFIVDKSLAPAGMTLTLAGGSALPNGGIPFHNGTGTDSLANAITAQESSQNDYVALAQNDATNVGLMAVDAASKAAFNVGLLEQYVVSTNTTEAGAVAIGQTAMNDQLGTLAWIQYGVEHPSRIAARVAALYSVTDLDDPNHNYDDNVLPGAAPQYAKTDIPNRATLNAALNASVMPLVTVNGKIQFSRAINSHSLTGSTPDFRTLDHGDTTVPIRVRKELLAEYAAMKLQNPFSGPDLDDNALPPAGMLTPGLWSSHVNALMSDWEGPQFNWVTEVEENPTQSEWDPNAERIMSAVPTIVKSQDHQLGVLIKQQAA